MSAQAHAIATGKAPARRNAEIMVVQEVTRWRREVERFTPERLEEFEAGAGTSRPPATPGGPVATFRCGRDFLHAANPASAGSGCTPRARFIPNSTSQPPTTGSGLNGGTMRLIPHHQDDTHGRPEYRSPDGTLTEAQMDAIALVPDAFHGDWNYKLVPRRS